MDTYTASNGIRINVAADLSGEKYLTGTRLSGGGCPDVYPTQTHATASEDGMTALREFFQAEADERLGRWRSVNDPEYTVTRKTKDELLITHDGGRWWYYHRGSDEATTETLAAIAHEFFAAHPEPTPAWQDAKDGEVWVMTVGAAGPEMVTHVDCSSGFPRFIDVKDDMSYGPQSGFTAGRRIWPEDDPS